MLETYTLHGKDRLLLLFAAIVVCVPPIAIEHDAGISEAVFALSLREMMLSGNWLIPTVGGLPWTESSPLVQWVALLAAKTFGISNVVTAVRFAGLIPLVLATLWTASFAASCTGRRSGVIAGFVLLTTLGIAENVWHGGNVIWLIAASCGFMKLLADLEIRVQAKSLMSGFANASATTRAASTPSILFVFSLSGLVTLIAGPVAALVTVFLPAAGHVIFRQRRAFRLSNPWVSGWLLTAIVAAAWPILASIIVGDTSATWLSVLRNHSDAHGSGNQLWQLVQMSLPWLPLMIVGQWSIRHDAFAGGHSRERLLACWSIIIPVAVFLLTPSTMNLALAAVGAWSVSAAIGVEWLARRVFKELPLLETRHNRAIFNKFLVGCAAVLSLTTVWNDLGDTPQVDRALLAEARTVAEEGHSVLVDMKLGDQAAAILLELDGLAVPMPPQYEPAVWENVVIISSERLQQDGIEQRAGIRFWQPQSHSDSQSDLIMVRIEQAETSPVLQMASEPVPARR